MKQTLFFLSLILFFSLSPARSQTPSLEPTDILVFDKATWLQPDRLKMTFNVKPQHRIYLESLKLRAQVGDELSFKNITISPLITFEDKYSQQTKQGVEGSFEVVADIFAKKDIKDDVYPLILEFQACSDEYCLFPQDFHFQTPLILKNSALSLNRLMSESLILAIIFVFFAGFLTSFTPCIFPMIPLTLAVLVPRGQQLNFSQKLTRSLSYVLGIALTYSAFGIIAATSGMMFGSLLGNKFVALGIALFFVLFAISMLGFFEIKTPRRLHTSSFFQRSNTFVFGLAAGIIAGPCVGPVLLSILTFISQTGNIKIGFLLMMSFAFGMGLIFIVLGVAGDVFRLLPKSGAWLNNVKYIFASIMLGLSIYYVLPVLNLVELILYIQFIILILLGCYLIFYEKTFHLQLSRRSKTFLKICSLGLVIGMVFTPLATGRFHTRSASSMAPGWQAYDAKTFSSLLKNGKPTVIDFYADWCLACKELKTVTFGNKDVVSESEFFNLIVVDATSSSSAIEQLKKDYQVMGLPTVVFYDKNGARKDELTLNSFEDPEGFLQRLRKLKESTP